MKLYLAATFLLIVAATIYSLDRGIYIGSVSTVSENILRKNCRYWFVTGITEIPAHGGMADRVPDGGFPRGLQLADESDKLYCRFFGE